MKEDKPVDGWNHIILEGFCTRHYSLSKDKYYYRVKSTDDIFDTEKIKNPDYDPNYKVPKKPDYCPGRICNKCYDNECPHLAMASPDDKELKKIHKKVDEIYKDD